MHTKAQRGALRGQRGLAGVILVASWLFRWCQPSLDKTNRPVRCVMGVLVLLSPQHACLFSSCSMWKMMIWSDAFSTAPPSRHTNQLASFSNV